MIYKDFLFELGCEELPTSALKKAGQDLIKLIEGELKGLNLEFDSIEGIASPRRLGALVKGLATTQSDQTLELRGPSKAVGFDDNGEPTKALLGFCKKNQIQPSELTEVETPKGTWLEYRGIKKGQDTADLLPDLLNRSIQKLPLPKKMRWGSTRQEFTRPVLWLVTLFGSDVLPCSMFDRVSGRESRGHRVHSPEVISLAHASEYFETLRSHRVLAHFEERKQRVLELAQSLSVKDEYTVITDNDLVDEVTALVEWPVPLMGVFSEAFLDVPSEALVSSMKEHQKYFHVHDANGKLVNRFVTMANLESKQPELVVSGNERVLNARLSDAKFFWDTDLKTPLADRSDKLDKIVFHEALGTLGDKCRRAGNLAAAIAPLFHVKPDDARSASTLSKCDLLSEMVLEFADLQGLMGTYYARREGMAQEFADALQEVYKPAGANDDVPSTSLGSVIALADKMDTLVGLFAVGQPPTGSKDPFALRRATLGMLRILLESGTRCDLQTLVKQSYTLLGSQATVADAETAVAQFITERLKVVLANQNISATVFSAVTSVRQPLCPVSIAERCQVLTDSLGSDDLAAVAAASKRISNLLDKSESTSDEVAPHLFSETAESDLWSAFVKADQAVSVALKADDFAAALKALGELRDSVDGYFDQVMVNTDDVAIRNNRLATLSALDSLFKSAVDLSQVGS